MSVVLITGVWVPSGRELSPPLTVLLTWANRSLRAENFPVIRPLGSRS
jgi:hypothetical protein